MWYTISHATLPALSVRSDRASTQNHTHRLAPRNLPLFCNNHFTGSITKTVFVVYLNGIPCHVDYNVMHLLRWDVMVKYVLVWCYIGHFVTWTNSMIVRSTATDKMPRSKQSNSMWVRLTETYAGNIWVLKFDATRTGAASTSRHMHMELHSGKINKRSGPDVIFSATLAWTNWSSALNITSSSGFVPCRRWYLLKKVSKRILFVYGVIIW